MTHDEHVREVERESQQAMILALDSEPTSQQLLFAYLYGCIVERDGFLTKHCRGRHAAYVDFISKNRFILEPVYNHFPKPVDPDFRVLVNGVYHEPQVQLDFDLGADKVLSAIQSLLPEPETYYWDMPDDPFA
ncbi:TPA: hypothetical protein LAL36_004346 [Escherichia coli]|nr:hypothetical protein [Escherichia coli]